MKIKVLGVSFDAVNKKEASAQILSAIQNKNKIPFTAVTPNPIMVMNAQKNEELFSALSSADLSLADGVGIISAAKRMGTPLPERVTGIDTAYSVLQKLTEIAGSVYLFGAKPGGAELAAEKLIDQFPACPVTLRYTCQPVPPPIHYCFIAVVKEALSNIARHSNATSATVSVLEHPALYQLIIEDNGSPSKLITQSTSSAEKDSSAGFFGSSHSRTTGIGLHNIQERVTALQGNMIIQTDRGFRIFISIPKNEQEVSQ